MPGQGVTLGVHTPASHKYSIRLKKLGRVSDEEKSLEKLKANVIKEYRGHIFSHVRPFYERAESNLDRSTHRSLWA